MDWQSLAIGAAIPPLLLLAGKGLSMALAAPRADSTERRLKVVITGSTKGLGRALAEKFLQLGDSVIITSRSTASCESVAAELGERFPNSLVKGFAADVRDADDMDALAQFAVREMGGCDIWVNNAGVVQPGRTKVADLDAKIIRDVVDSNLLGSFFGSRAAIRVMSKQEGGGKVFLMDGRGALGEATPEAAAYGATKRAVPQLARSLAKECRGSNVSVHTVSPGMVVTDLLIPKEQRDTNRSLVRIVNILAEFPETVAEWMVPRLRGVTGTGKYFRFLTAHGVIYRFATAGMRTNRLLPMPPRTTASMTKSKPE